MQQTNHYQLNQWDLEDRVLMADFNNDNTKIETALHGLAEQAAGKADAAALAAAVSRVTALEDGKADKTALSAEQTARQNADNAEKAAREAAVAALRNENCWVKLSDETLDTAASSYTWAITSPADYAQLRCVFTMACTGNVVFNVQNGAVLNKVDTGMGTDKMTACLLLGFPSPCAGGQIRLSPLGGSGNALIRYEFASIAENGRFFCPNGYLATAELACHQISSVKLFSEDGAFSAGSRFLLYGLKR